MAVLPIRKYGDPVLRRKAEPVDRFDEELLNLVDDMIDTMEAAEGIGLAAPQVGVSKAVCVVNMHYIQEGTPPQAFVNPEILEEFGENVSMEEGCLSIPGIAEEVTRKKGIRIRYQDLEGNVHETQCTDMLARVLQHEVDHLHGIFFTDRLGPMKRKLLAKKLKAIAEEAQKELAERQLHGVG